MPSTYSPYPRCTSILLINRFTITATNTALTALSTPISDSSIPAMYATDCHSIRSVPLFSGKVGIYQVWIIVRALFNHLSGGFAGLNAHIGVAYHLITTLIVRFPALNVAYHQVVGG